MKRLVIVFLVLALTVSALAGVSSMASKLPRNAETVFVIEDLKANYEKMKTTTFLDFFLEQLAVEILIQQYFEMIVYNSGSRPSDIYPAISADVGFATWYSPESMKMKSIIVLGPMDRPSSARTALRNVLPQFISPQDVPEIQVEGSYLYLGDVKEFAFAEKGFPTDKLIDGLPKGFGYFYAGTDEILQRSSVRVDQGRFVIDGHIVGLTEETRQVLKKLPREEGTLDLEMMNHYSLVAAVLSVNEPSAFEELLGVVLGIALQIPGTQEMEIDEALPLIAQIIGNVTGRVMLDFSVPVEDIFSALLSLQLQGDPDIDVPSYDYLTRYEFLGDIYEIKALLDVVGIEYTESDGAFRTEDGQHLWLDEGWLFQSNSRKATTDDRLQKSKSAFESLNYRALIENIPEERFIVLFADTGHFLAGLLGSGQIESGLLAAAWYSQDNDLIEFKAILK